MKIYEVTKNVIIDNKDGWGAVPFNQNIDYMGLRVLMKPSIFLQLAATLENPTSSKNIEKHLLDGGSIGSPFLNISIPEEWEDDDYSKPAKVSGHEGRNRMMAVKNINGDQPIEVHLFFRNGIRNRHITDDWKKELINKMIKENSEDVINGPLFSTYKSNLTENKESYNWLKEYTEYGYNKYPSENSLKYLLKKYPNEQSITIYRGLHFDTKEEYDKFMSSFNSKVTTKVISSWSPSYSTAEEFAMTKKTYHPTAMIMSQEMEREKAKEYMTGYRGIVLKTTISPNTGIDVDKTKHAKESEIILPPGTYNVEISTVKKKFKHKIEDGEDTIGSIIDKMIDPKYKDDQYYKNFFEFIKHNYPEDIRQSDELKQKIVKMINQKYKKMDFVSHELQKWEFSRNQTDVNIYFNYNIFNLFEQGFLPDKYEKYVEQYANKIIQEYYNLVKQYSGKEYMYNFGNLRYLEKYASPKYVSLIRKILQMQVANVYHLINDKTEIDKINSIKDDKERRKVMDQFKDNVKRVFSQLK
jgi:hypothetical protein